MNVVLDKVVLTKGLIVVTGVLLLGSAYFIGFNRNVAQTAFLQQKTLRLTKAMAESTLISRQLSIENTEFKLQQAADSQMIAGLQSMLKEIRIGQTRVDEELRMFRSLASGDNRESGLSVQGLKLLERSAGGFSADVTLTQARGRKRIAGEVLLEVSGYPSGSESEQVQTLDLAELTQKRVSGLAFDFRYFQYVSAEFSLPEGFEAKQIRVVAKPRKGSPRTIRTTSRQFDWVPITLARAALPQP